MQTCKVGKFLAFALLIVFLPRLSAEDKRSIPLDFYIIIDGSEAFQSSKTNAIAWINENVVDRLLLDGDKISVWAAGDRAELVYSGDVSASGGNGAIKDRLLSIGATGKSADFSGALRNVNALVSGAAGGRLPYTMLVTASAGGLESALAADAQGLFRWFRTEKHEQWQVLVVAPDIGRKVNQAALAYMNSQQGR
jgi:hypothetical protein